MFLDYYISSDKEISVDGRVIDKAFSEEDAYVAFNENNIDAQSVESVLDKALAPQGNGKKRSNKYKKCFLLMWRYGKTDREIAHTLKISRSSVRAHIHRAIKKIQKELISIKK